MKCLTESQTRTKEEVALYMDVINKVRLSQAPSQRHKLGLTFSCLTITTK